MMLWSDNITRAQGEICLEMFGIWQPTQFRLEKKKNLLTFSATTNAGLTQKQKRKKKGWNEQFKVEILLLGAKNDNSAGSCSHLNAHFESLVLLFLSAAFAYFYVLYFVSPVIRGCLIISCLWLRRAVSKWDSGDNIWQRVVSVRRQYLFYWFDCRCVGYTCFVKMTQMQFNTVTIKLKLNIGHLKPAL